LNPTGEEMKKEKAVDDLWTKVSKNDNKITDDE
jgi:hypothetical protein